MQGQRLRLGGYGLLEVLVALTIVAVNVLGWMATLHVVLMLVRRVGELANGVDPALVASVACGLGLLVPRGAPWRVVYGADRSRFRHRGGMTLVELLVALAVGAFVLAGLATATAITSRAARAATRSLDAATVRAALPALLRDVVESAGRGMPSECGLATAAGSSRLSVRRGLGDGSVVVDEVFAGLDGGARPALYLRRVPYTRQPWVENVTEFTVERIDFTSSGADEPSRADRLVARIVHSVLDDALDVEIVLPHLPCLDPLP